MRAFVAAFFLIACMVEFVLAFMFVLPDDRWLAFVIMVFNVIGVYLAWTVITSRGKLK